MKCFRGFLMMRNMKTGDTRPFFLKVREEDIVWKGEAGTPSDIEKNGISDGWLYETHTLLNRVSMSTHTALPALTYVTTRTAKTTIRLPKEINASTAVIMIEKFSNGIKIVESSSIEAELIDVTDTGLSSTLEITLINPFGDFNSSNIESVSAMVNITINGFSI